MKAAADSTGIIEGPAGRRFAIGLVWSTATPGEVDDNAREAARAVDCDLYAPRDGDACQFGLGRRSLGHRPGLRSAALAAVRSAYALRIRDFVAVVALGPVSGGGFWCLAVRDDIIKPDGDVRAADEAEAIAFLKHELETHAYADIFAPAEFAVANARQIRLDELLVDIRNTALKAVRRNWRAPLLAAAASLCLLWLSLEAWELFQRQLSEAAETEARLARLEAERQARNGIKRPWSSAPTPSAVVAACVEGAARLPLSPPGWALERLGCSRDEAAGALTVRLVWRRAGGTLATLAEAVDAARSATQEGIRMSRLLLKPLEQGLLVEAGYSESLVSTRAAPDPSGPVEALEWAIQSGVQAAGPAFMLALERQAPQTLAPATGSAPALVVSWSKARIEAAADPRLWMPLVERPGVVVSHLQFEAQLGRWTLLASLYEPVRLVGGPSSPRPGAGS